MIFLKTILMILLGGALWAWRGSKYTFGNFITALLCAVGMVLGFNYFLGVGLPMGNLVGAIVILAWTEMVLGYGATTSRINLLDKSYCIDSEIETDIKEDYVCLGLISMSYSLLPSLFLLPGKQPFVYIIIAMVGFTGFPLAKYVDIRLREKNFKGDAWKVAEAIIGTIILISWTMGAIF